MAAAAAVVVGCWCEKTRVAFLVLIEQQKQRDRRATQRDQSDQDAASSRDGVRVVWRCRERRWRHDDDSRRPVRAFATSPRLVSAIFAPPPNMAHRPSRACCGMTRPRSKIQQNNEMATRRTAEWALNQSRWSEPPTKTNSTVSRPVALAEPPASRLAESTRHTNMSERALSLFLHRTSPRFRTSRVSRQPNQRRRHAERRPGAKERAGRYAHAPDPRVHDVARTGAPGSSARYGLHTLTRHAHVRRWSSRSRFLLIVP